MAEQQVELTKKRKSYYEDVEEFSFFPSKRLGTNAPLELVKPKQPVALSMDAITKLGAFAFSEWLEIVHTREPDFEKAKDIAHKALDGALAYAKKHFETEPVPKNAAEVVRAQADGVCDMIFYSLNVTNQNGIDVDKVWNRVTEANMKKTWDDGLFRRDTPEKNDKVTKPADFKSPNFDDLFENAVIDDTWNAVKDVAAVEEPKSEA